ncbi:hypothetical protein LINPERHAP1_LOCUS9406 [Linum perenne]
MPHKPDYVQQLENRVSQLETILRSIAPTQFVGSSSSAAVPPQTQDHQQSYVPQPPTYHPISQPTDQSQFAEFDFDLENLPAHLASWMNNQPWDAPVYQN